MLIVYVMLSHNWGSNTLCTCICLCYVCWWTSSFLCIL